MTDHLGTHLDAVAHTAAAPNILTVTIPGEPVAQGRPRGFMRPGMKGPRFFDPAKSKSWKGVAQVHYQKALEDARIEAPAFPDGALSIVVTAVFTCPKSAYRKIPVPRRPKTGRPDCDNLIKIVQDAGNGLLWTDDAQIAIAQVRKLVGAQGEAPRVEIMVRKLTEDA